MVNFVHLMLQGIRDPAHSMCNKGGGAPSPDPLVGKAMLKQAELGEEAFEFYTNWFNTEGKQRQAVQDDLADRLTKSDIEIQDEQLAQGRDLYAHWTDNFKGAEERLMADAEAYDSPAETERLAGVGIADTQQAFARTKEQMLRDRGRYGVNPNSGAAMQQESDHGLARAATEAQVANTSRVQSRDMGFARRMDAASMGRGLPGNAVNSYGVALDASATANNTSLANLNAARGGLGVMGGAYNAAAQGWSNAANIGMGEYGLRMRAYEANQSKNGAIWGAVGTAVGGIGGFMLGGPPGALAGASAGRAAGTGMSQDNWVVDGGMIHGPGTGTSDSIQGVNTDTGEAVHISNGEYVIPADVVRAKGVEFFDKLRDKYHTPVNRGVQMGGQHGRR